MHSVKFCIFRHIRTFTFFAVAVVATVTMGLACAKKVETRQTASADHVPSAKPAQTPAPLTTKSCPQPKRDEQHIGKDCTTPSTLATQEAVASRRTPNVEKSDYVQHIEKQREYFHTLRRDSRLDEAMQILKDILTDIEQNEGVNMAQRAALADGATLQTDKDYLAAIRVYQILLERFPEGQFIDKALYHQGECHLELQEYEQAEAVWHRLIEEQDSAPLAPWGWRKLALAQLLRGQFDASMSTLEIMTDKYTKTHWAEYAKMRRGYVLTVANRVPEAKAAYQKFLSECSDSRYCILAKKQLAELDGAVAIAKERKH